MSYTAVSSILVCFVAVVAAAVSYFSCILAMALSSGHLFHNYFPPIRCRRNMSGLQRIFLDWSSSTLREKHLKGRIPSQRNTGGAAAISSSSRPVRQNKLAQWQTSIAKNTVAKRYVDIQVGFSKFFWPESPNSSFLFGFTQSMRYRISSI